MVPLDSFYWCVKNINLWNVNATKIFIYITSFGIVMGFRYCWCSDVLEFVQVGSTREF